ncbi:hypothetical protein C8R43DRAFT_1232755 [Mycena crocata]|nr:hypothetical protein C8R43DRAFT_1232755 [Mycena crocata]
MQSLHAGCSLTTRSTNNKAAEFKCGHNPCCVTAVPIQECSPEFLQLESSIRALSTAIHEIQGQCEFRIPTSCGPYTVDKDRSRAFSHLATLLTTGSPLGRQRVAVTGGSSHHGFYINATEIVVGNEQQKSNEPAAVRLTTILPSGKSLKQLAEDKRPLSEISLAEHAGDVFQALRLFGKHKYSRQKRTLDRFIVRRCHPEIHRRLQNAVGLLDPPLHDVLSKWELHSVDPVRESWLVIPYPIILIQNFGIPHRPMSRWPDRTELLFNRETFPRWKQFFLSLLRVVIATVGGLDTQHSDTTADVVLALHFLRLFLSFGPARAILDAPTIAPMLHLLPQHKLEYHDRQERSPVDIIFGAWNAVVAYDAAVSSLTARRSTASEILRCSLPKVHLIHSSIASKTCSMDSIPHIMRSKVIPALKLSKYYISVVETVISRHLSVAEFPGTVHCEASMMGIAYAFSDGKYSRGDIALERTNADAFREAFEGYSNTIGVTEKSCQICYWLSEELSLSNGYFNLRQSHGKTVPWSPPRFGIPFSVLRNLELELLELLKDSTQRWLEQKTRWPRELDVSQPF